MAKYLGDNKTTAVKLPCTAASADDVLLVTSSDPTKATFGKAATNNIADGAITSAKIGTGQVATLNIAAGAVTTSALASGAVDSTKLATGSVTSTAIASNAVTSSAIASGAVTASAIGTGAVTSSAIASNAVTSTAIASGAVTSSAIATGAVSSAAIASNAVTSAAIATGAVTSAAIGAGAVTSSAIANGSVDGTKITSGALTLSSSSVTVQGPSTFQAPLNINTQAAFLPVASDGMPFAAVYDRAATNLVVNPSFEVNVTDGWTATSGATVSRITTDYFFGSACAQIVVDTTAGEKGIFSNTATTTAGAPWACQAYVKASTGTVNVDISLEFLDSGNTILLTSRGTWIIGTSWTFIGRTVDSAPTNTAKVRMRVESADTSKTFLVDGCQLELRPSISVVMSSYLDGSLGPGYSWSGTAHNSTSSRTGGFQPLGPMSNASGIPNFQPSIVIWDDATTWGSQFWGREFSGISGIPGVRSGFGALAELWGDVTGEWSGGLYGTRVQASPVEGQPASQNIDLELRPNGSGRVVLNGRVRAGLSGNRLLLSGAGTAFPSSPETNEVFFRTDYKSLYSYDGSNWGPLGGEPPVGSIIAYTNHIVGTPTGQVDLTTSYTGKPWHACDGSTVSDTESPINGKTLPSLNSTNRFLRGNTSSGTTHTDNIGSHTHLGTGAQGGATGNLTVNGAQQSASGSAFVNFNGLGSVHNVINGSTSGPTNNDGVRGNEPANMDVIWIIRIK